MCSWNWRLFILCDLHCFRVSIYVFSFWFKYIKIIKFKLWSRKGMKVYVWVSPRVAVAVGITRQCILYQWLRICIYRHSYCQSLSWIIWHKVLYPIILLHSLWPRNLYADIALLVERRQILFGLLCWPDGSSVLRDRLFHRTVRSGHLRCHVVVLCLVSGLCGRKLHHPAVRLRFCLPSALHVLYIQLPLTMSLYQSFLITDFPIYSGYRSSGSVDPNVCTNLKAAYTAGFKTRDVYIFPCENPFDPYLSIIVFF